MTEEAKTEETVLPKAEDFTLGDVDTPTSKEEIEEDSDSGGEDPTPEELTPKEQEAWDKGWRPLDKWLEDGKDEDDFVSANEFLSRSSLFKAIDNRNQEIDKLKSVVEGLKKHYDKVKDAAYKQAVEDLRKEKVQAMSEGEWDRVLEIEEQEKGLSPPEEEEEITNPEDAPVFKEWLTDNPWYKEKDKLRRYADITGYEIRQGNPDMSDAELFKKVADEVKAAFPDEFGGRGRLPNRGDKPGNSSRGGSSRDYQKMTPEEKAMCKRFVDAGVMTQEQYISDLKESGAFANR